MATVTVSPKFQVVIPKEIREKLGIQAGHKMQVIHYQDRIEFILLKDVKKMKGFLKGMDTAIKREKD